MKLEWSADYGRTWHPIEVANTTPVATYIRQGDHPYNDGCGNVYRRPLVVEESNASGKPGPAGVGHPRQEGAA